MLNCPGEPGEPYKSAVRPPWDPRQENGTQEAITTSQECRVPLRQRELAVKWRWQRGKIVSTRKNPSRT